MSQPLLTKNSKVIDITAGATTSSSLIDISDCTLIAIQAIWTGLTPVGSIAIEGSLDGVTFTTISGTPISVSGASGNGILTLGPTAVPFVRVTFTYTSGTVSSLKVYASCKQAA